MTIFHDEYKNRDFRHVSCCISETVQERDTRCSELVWNRICTDHDRIALLRIILRSFRTTAQLLLCLHTWLLVCTYVIHGYVMTSADFEQYLNYITKTTRGNNEVAAGNIE